jgi:tetratricopeptide (TPR) repeat protein
VKPSSWILPIVVLAAVLVGVWYFVFRATPEERADRLMKEARLAMQTQDYVTAEDRLQSALRLTPGNGVLLHNLGILYLQQNRLADARNAFERAAESHGPQASQLRAEELFQLATISYLEKNWAQAADELERAIAADPTREQLHGRLLDLQLGRLEDRVAADSTAARFLRLCGRTPRNLYDIGLLYYQNGVYDVAADRARAAVAMQDSLVEAHALLARALWKSDRIQEGLKSLQGPMQRYPKAPELWIAQSLLLGEGRSRDDALAAADRAVALAPNDFEAHQARQKALALLGRYQEASQEIDVARRLTQDPGQLRMLQTQQGLLKRMMNMTGGSGGVMTGADSGRVGP